MEGEKYGPRSQEMIAVLCMKSWRDKPVCKCSCLQLGQKFHGARIWGDFCINAVMACFDFVMGFYSSCQMKV